MMINKLKHIVLVAAACILAAATAVSAQVMKQVPASAFVVLKVNNLDGTNKKVANLAALLGLQQMLPDAADPLSAFLKHVGANDGINRDGDLAFAFIDPSANGTEKDQSMLLLLPVSDYQKFIGNFADAKPDGDLTQVHFNQMAETTYVAHWGDYAAASPSRAIVATAPTDIIQVDGLAAKELDAKDVILLANFKAMRPKMLQGIDQGRQAAAPFIDQMVQQFAKMQNLDAAKFQPVAKVIVDQCLDLAQKFAQSADDACLSFNLSGDGVASTFSCQFQSDSTFAQYLGGIKNTDDSFLTGLASGKYLLFGGSAAPTPQLTKAFADFLAPIQTSINNLGPDYSPVNDWLNAIQKISGASGPATFGLLCPSAQPGAGPLIQFVNIRQGDAKTMLDGYRQMEDSQQAMMKAFGLTQVAGSQVFTRDAKTVDGIAFDEMKSQIPMNGNNPGQMQAMQLISMIYGPQGPDVFTGVVNDNNLLTVMGLDDAGISAAIAAVKTGDDPLAKLATTKTVASQLPTDRSAAMYIPLDLWASTGFGYAKMFGIDMGVTMPENLPPLGVAVSTDGPAVRVDSFMPSQLLQAIAAAGMQVYLKTQTPQPPPPGGGPAPGGL
jgi:hypothetical protein